MDLDLYLKRIGYSGSREPTIETLRAMQLAHFYNVPFENLDIARGVRIEVDEAINFNKIVRQKRGGFCLELSGLFARALRAMGFKVDILAARVLNAGCLGPPLSHMTLLVHLDEPWIADVGYGGRIAGPLRLLHNQEQKYEGRTYILAQEGDYWFVTNIEAGAPSVSYLFNQRKHSFADFMPICEWLQTSPDSRFTQGSIVSLATPTGRKSITKTTLILTDRDQRQETEIETLAEEQRLLRELFGISFG